MSTTSVIIEFLISGIQASIWLFILLCSTFGIKWVPSVSLLFEDWSSVFAILVFAIVYSLGIISDRLALVIFGLVNPMKLLEKSNWIKRKLSSGINEIHIFALVREGQVSSLLNLNRIRIRIVRSTILNTVMIVVSSYIFIKKQGDALWGSDTELVLSGLLAVGIPLIFVSFIILGLLNLGFKFDVEVAKKEIKKIEKRKSKSLKSNNNETFTKD